jgi:hypothetical protein
MSWKFFKGDPDNEITLVPMFTNTINTHRFEDVEYCFQFNEGEPVVFGVGQNELHITISPTAQGNIIFNDGNGSVFKIFARERLHGGNRA